MIVNSVRHGWAVKWRSGPDNVDKKVNEHLNYPMPAETKPSWTTRHPVFFKTRREARYWAQKHYGYIARRGDLRKYPHDWKPPLVVRATLTVQEITSDDNPSRSSRSLRRQRPASGLTDRDLADAMCAGAGR